MPISHYKSVLYCPNKMWQPAITSLLKSELDPAGATALRSAKTFPMKHASIAILLAIGLQACERKVSLDESAIRSWASSSEVVSRSRPSIYGHQEADGSYVAVGAGNFKEISDGIDLNSMGPLPEGFYVFPGKIWVRTIDEAIQTMRRIKPGTINPKAEQAGGGQPATRSEFE